MLLIAGLGNPGKAYQFTRHNLGFLSLQALAERHRISLNRKRFESLFGQGEIDGRSVILLTPLTYMNRSGSAVGECLRFFRLSPEDLIVVHDDLDLAWQQLRIVSGGGAAGHKGVLSLFQHLGSREFIRIRMGVGRPPEGVPPESYVLQCFSAEEKKALSQVIDRSCEAVETIIHQGLKAAMNRFNVRKPLQEGS